MEKMWTCLRALEKLQAVESEATGRWTAHVTWGPTGQPTWRPLSLFLAEHFLDAYLPHANKEGVEASDPWLWSCLTHQLRHWVPADELSGQCRSLRHISLSLLWGAVKIPRSQGLKKKRLETTISNQWAEPWAQGQAPVFRFSHVGLC